MAALKGEAWVLGVAMCLPTAASAVYFVGLSAEPVSEPLANPLMVGAYAASKVLQFSLPVLWLAFADPIALRTFRLSFRGVPAGLAFGVAVALFAFTLYFGWLAASPLFVGVPDRVRIKLAEIGAGTPARFLLMAGFLALVHSLLEEYYWRWFVYGRLRHHLPRILALVLAGVAFMGHHVIVLGVYFPGWFCTAVLPFSLAIAVGGIVWAWLYERTGSLLGPWVSHFLVDAALLVIGYDLAFRRG
jgi:membrane protease YdiL (CAAX protease family)